jgi:hypothetical protein
MYSKVLGTVPLSLYSNSATARSDASSNSENAALYRVNGGLQPPTPSTMLTTRFSATPAWVGPRGILTLSLLAGFETLLSWPRYLRAYITVSNKW